MAELKRNARQVAALRRRLLEASRGDFKFYSGTVEEIIAAELFPAEKIARHPRGCRTTTPRGEVVRFQPEGDPGRLMVWIVRDPSFGPFLTKLRRFEAGIERRLSGT